MTSSSGRSSGSRLSSRFSWQRELPPVLVVAGLAADYLSPAAFWTMLLPFGAVVLLLSLRKPLHAGAVFLLCSWVLIPTAVQAVSALEDMRGQRRLFVVPDATQETLPDAFVDPDLPEQVEFLVLPVGPEHLINPRWALRETIVTFAELHNQLLIDQWRATSERSPAEAADAAPVDP